jgi:hypothetical protein
MSAAAAAAPDSAAAKDVGSGHLDSDVGPLSQLLLGAQGASEAARRGAEADQHMGAVEPVLKMQLRKQTAHIVR